MRQLFIKAGTKYETTVHKDRNKVGDNYSWRQGQSLRQLYIKTEPELLITETWDGLEQHADGYQDFETIKNFWQKFNVKAQCERLYLIYVKQNNLISQLISQPYLISLNLFKY